MTTLTRAGSTFANITTVGTENWINPASASLSDTVSAYVSASTGGTYRSRYLQVINMGASVPISASVNGWTWSITRNCSDALATRQVRDYTVESLLDGAISGNNKADTVSLWNNSACTITYGASNDTWGNGVVSPSVINASNFGMSISCSLHRASTIITGSINYIELAVTYTDTVGGTSKAVYSMYFNRQHNT